MYKTEKKQKVSRSFIVLENELVAQGLVSDRSEPRELYTPYPPPVVDVRRLEKRIEELERLVAKFLD